MVQNGLNAGPRHSRIWGFVNNLKCKWSSGDRLAKDTRILGVLAIAFNIFCAKSPKEVVDGTLKAIESSGMPVFGVPNDTCG